MSLSDIHHWKCSTATTIFSKFCNVFIIIEMDTARIETGWTDEWIILYLIFISNFSVDGIRRIFVLSTINHLKHTKCHVQVIKLQVGFYNCSDLYSCKNIDWFIFDWLWLRYHHIIWKEVLWKIAFYGKRLIKMYLAIRFISKEKCRNMGFVT